MCAPVGAHCCYSCGTLSSCGLVEARDGACGAGDGELAFYADGHFCEGREDGFGEVAYGGAGGGEERVEG